MSKFYDIFIKNNINRIQEYIIRTYNLRNKDGSLNTAARRMTSEGSFEKWYDGLKAYKYDDVINAIDLYFQTKSNKTEPQVYQLVKILEQNKSNQTVNTEWKKPICHVTKWQEDFDYVLQKACTYGIVFNPYWYSKGYKSIGETYVRDIQGNLTKKTWKMYWKDALTLAKKQEPEKFSMISKFDDYMLEYTLAYRLGILKI